MIRRLGEPVVRTAVGRAMKLMGRQFVLGENIGAAMERARTLEAKGYTYSYDMLGEAARTDARRRALRRRLRQGDRRHRRAGQGRRARRARASRSSCRRCIRATNGRTAGTVMSVLLPRARALARAAARAGIGFNIDAEEAERLDLSLDVIEALLDGRGARRLGRLRRGGAGLWPPGRGGDRLAGRAGAPARPPADGAAGQGRLLGRRDQAGAGARAAGLPGLHPQALDRRELSSATRGRCWRRATGSIRSSPPTTPTPSRRCWRWPATGRASSSSDCTAWARRCTRSCASARARAAGSTRRWARIAICWPTWCGGCWRTAPTRPSSTRSSTSGWRRRRSPPTRWPRSRAWATPSPTRASAGRPRCSRRG